MSEPEAAEIRRGQAFIQLKNGPFDLNSILAPDGIERFEEGWRGRVEKAANRSKDLESLPRLLSFRDWLRSRR
jgi:hypothetical protein